LKEQYQKFKSFIQDILDTIRSSFWFLPTLMTLSSAFVALIVRQFNHTDETAKSSLFSLIAPVDADGTRSILSVIAGSMVTVTGVVFSIVIVALTLASSQFGPRLLRNYLRDRTNQFAFGAFVSTFIFSLIILSGVRESEIPLIGTTMTILLTVGSLFVLIYFIHNTSTSIQASSIIASVAHELNHQVEKRFSEERNTVDEDKEIEVQNLLQKVESNGTVIPSTHEGFMRLIDYNNLLELCMDNDLYIKICQRPGEFMIKNSPAAIVSSENEIDKELPSKISECFLTGKYRTAVQDIFFPIDQLNEIAIRALSPSLNDPKTACDCINRTFSFIAKIVNKDFPVSYHCDEDEKVRIYSHKTSFEEIISRCYDPVMRYGIEHYDLIETMLKSTECILSICEEEDREKIIRKKISDFQKLVELKHKGKESDYIYTETKEIFESF